MKSVVDFRDFGVLKETRKEYWGIQIVNFLDSMFSFAMITVVSMFLSNDLGVDDKQAGYSVTVFTSASTLLLLFSGAATDWLGIRRSIIHHGGGDRRIVPGGRQAMIRDEAQLVGPDETLTAGNRRPRPQRRTHSAH